MTLLTPSQKRAMDFLLSFQNKYGYAPTRKELAEGLEYRSENAAQDMLARLARKGLIRMDKNQARSIHIIGYLAPPPVAVPVTQDFLMQKVMDAIDARDPKKAHAMLLASSEKYADSLLDHLLPESRSAQFLFRNLPFVKAHFISIFGRVEGKIGAKKKTNAAIRILTRQFLPIGDFSEQVVTDLEIAIGGAFRLQNELFCFFDSISDLYGGDGESYFEFLKNLPLQKKK